MKPGRDLDALIAEKVMGLNLRARDAWGCPTCHKNFYSEDDALPYSTDIAAALDVLFKVCKDLQCGWEIERHDSDGRLYVTIKGQGEGEFWEAKIHSAKQSDIPYAICLVALNAIEHK